jgi:predicted nucleic acid-binding protein
VIVVDASALLEVLLQSDAAASVEARLFDGSTLHAPYLLDLEVAQVCGATSRPAS